MTAAPPAPRWISLRWLALALVGATAVGVGAAAAAARPRNRNVPEPARSVDLAAYAGRWYEMARYDNAFERGCEGVTADYAPRPDGLVAVTNTCRVGTPEGRVRRARGRARPVAGAHGAKLKVSFFGPFFVGDYWVLDHADDYAWSIVGEPSGHYLWILTREARPPPAVRADLLRRAAALGYDPSAIRETRQG